MNKRIICLILTVVMLALSLTGCGYAYQNDDLDQYVEFDAEAFKTALKNLAIEDGDFTDTDAETRSNMVYDAIYAAIASASTSTEKKTAGVIGDHDKLHYCYYITFVDGEGENAKVIEIAPDYMKTAKAVALQLGKKVTTDLEKEILSKMSGYDFTEKAYSNVTSGRVEAGTVAYISYHYAYNEIVNGETVTREKDVALQRVTLTKGDPIHDLLISEKKEGEDAYNTEVGVAIGTASSKSITISTGYNLNNTLVPAGTDITITKAKIEYAVKNGADADNIFGADGFTNTTYTEKTTMKDIYGNEWDLKDRALTYYVFPYAYSQVDELNATNIISLIFGKDFTEAVAKSIVFGADFASKSEEDQKALLDSFKLKTDDGEKDFVTAVTDLNKLLTEYNTAKSSLTTEESNLSTAISTEASKKTAAEAEGATQDDKDAYEAAKKSRESYELSVAKAKTALSEAEAKRDEAIVAFLAKDYTFAKSLFEAKKAYDTAAADEATKKTAAEAEGATQEAKDAYEAAKGVTAEKKTAYDALAAEVATKTAAVEAVVCNGYTNYKYDELQTAYRTEIKNKLATAIYKLIDESVKVVGYPEEAVDEVYDQLINDYKYDFYKGTVSSSSSSSSTSTSSETNYSKHNGSFKKFLIYTVSADITTVESYKDAKEAVRAHAQELVAPVIKFTVAAKALDLLYTDEEFKQYKKDYSENNVENYQDSYEYNEFYYGESTVRNTLQFDKLMNWLLESEEKVDENDSKFVKDVYNTDRIKFTK